MKYQAPRVYSELITNYCMLSIIGSPLVMCDKVLEEEEEEEEILFNRCRLPIRRQGRP